MKKYMFLLSAMFIVVSCNQQAKAPNPQNLSLSDSNSNIAQPDFSYRIVKEEIHKSVDENSLYIELSKKISKEQLTTLAQNFRKNRSDYGRLYIFYSLKGMKSNSGAWATTNFDPDLEVKILGSTEEEQKKTNDVSIQNIDGKIIGRWHEDQYTSSTFIIFERNGKTYMRQIIEGGVLAHGSKDPIIMPDEILLKKKVRGETRLMGTEDAYTYYIIGEDGNVKFYDTNDGYFTMGVKIN